VLGVLLAGTNAAQNVISGGRKMLNYSMFLELIYERNLLNTLSVSSQKNLR
jgi:hypothetical protein